MAMNSSAPAATAKKKLLSRMALAQRKADHAKKAAKLAKLGLRAAKDKFKSAKRAAKKLRKEVKALKGELAAFATKPAPRKRVASKPIKKRVRLTPAPVPAPVPEVVESSPVLPDSGPAQ